MILVRGRRKFKLETYDGVFGMHRGRRPFQVPLEQSEQAQTVVLVALYES